MPTNKKIPSKKESSQSKNGVQKPETSRKSQDDKTTSEGHCPESQPAILSTEDIETVNEVSKLSIAHEIIVNQNFVVEENYLPQGSLENKFVETMCNAFWDHLKNQLSSTPPDFSCALELINNIKQILVSLLLPRQNHLRNEIEEALDMDLLKQETEHGALDVPHLSNYILNLMALMCAPVRDEAVQKLESIKDPVQLLRGITQVLDLMKMDMINYTIKSIRPYLLEHSIEYERAKFQELLDKQPEQRIHLFLKSCLIHGMQESLLDVPGGLLFIEPELAELGWKFVNLMHHNQQVYNPYYAEILTNIISS
ncbi:T-complex protein 11 X-linked protein 2-like [Psammomys obesus]|uniref:T-complex protein 11 X-linked protein 2-like n=1 Tax=Psammomys obesus TaxID=48139 RepID=UPI0024529E56|nr:T-complex protein 11 X-linked protein 2-like [Psammomys obesus]